MHHTKRSAATFVTFLAQLQLVRSHIYSSSNLRTRTRSLDLGTGNISFLFFRRARPHTRTSLHPSSQRGPGCYVLYFQIGF
ncbi:hypothetical protein BDN72DRAFT_834921 [Pluteus cervinus]|uniref:Uncharacterized protein n=1 Tax=Pluteus cervinus TaxID=181527 RepID=A0ACD3B620_9AGAR|nr:hypothetical protein BDN72DRAFT_834921 [Pluteus cervinus]